MRTLYFDEFNSATLDITNLTDLNFLYCRNSTMLTTLNVTGLSSLKELHCNNNQLTALTVTNLPELNYLHCENNQLTSFDVSNLTNLTTFSCYHNNFTTQALDEIYCALPQASFSWIYPASSPTDVNIDVVLATNAQNARAKQWRVQYPGTDGTYELDIPTTGTYECTTDINAIELERNINVFPNPTSDLLNINSDYIIEKIRVYDMLGKEVINRPIDYVRNTSINVSSLSSGTYLLYVYTDKGVGRHIFIKK